MGIQAADAASFEFTNKSGKDIVAIAVKQAGTGEYPANMMADGLVVKSGDTVMLACPAIPEAGAADSAAKRLADIAISFADGSACELHEVDVHDIAAADLRLDGDVAYLEYTAAGTSKKVSTQDAEKAVAQQAADAAAQEEGTEGGSEDGGEAYEEEVYIDDSAVGDGDEESCVPDIVLR